MSMQIDVFSVAEHLFSPLRNTAVRIYFCLYYLYAFIVKFFQIRDIYRGSEQVRASWLSICDNDVNRDLSRVFLLRDVKVYKNIFIYLNIYGTEKYIYLTI